MRALLFTPVANPLYIVRVLFRTIILAGCLTLVACTHSSRKPAGVSPFVILETKGRTLRVALEVVRTPKERERGLMYRRELAEFQGMLFIFDRQENQSFWMKNTYLPLDMIFINEAMQIVGIVKSAEPLTTTSRRVDAPSRYVLEVIGGFSDKNGVDVGNRVRFEGLEL